MVKKLLIGLGVVIVLLIAAAVIVPTFIPVETYKAQIAEQVRKNTGRDFEIAGDVSFSVFPTLGFEANGIRFGNGQGYTDANMAALSQVVVAVKFAPLLGGSIEVDRFVLVDPVISLEVAKDGTPNWEFAGAKGPEGAPQQTPAEQPGSAEAGGGFDLAALKLGEVRLENGTINYRDQRTGQAVNLSNINMDLELPGLDAPMAANGRATWNGEEVSVRLDVNTPQDLLDGRRTPVVLNVDSKPITLAFKGELANAEVLTGGGPVELDVPSVRELAAWAGAPLEVGEQGFGPLQIKGTLGLDGARYSFSDAEIAFDDIRGTGGVAFDGSGKVPYVQAALTVERLDLNPYLPGEPVLAAPADGTDGSSGQAAGSPAPAGGWSDEPIDASGLKAVNADLEFRSGEILIRNIKIDRGAVNVALKGGVANVTLADLALYGGQGQGALSLDASGKVLGLKQQLQVTDIQAKPLLRDAVGSEILEGGGTMTVDVTSRGASQRQLVSNLNGNGSFKFLDGAINGINVAEIVRRIGSLDVKAVFDPGSMDVPQKTDFAELSGTYVIRQGIAQNDDLLMLSPLLRMTGKGSADMPQRTIDYRVEPKVVASLQGQGGRKDLKGLVVPFAIRGSWDKPQIAPDLAGLISSDPKGAVEGIIEGVTGKKKSLPTIPGLGSGSGENAPGADGEPAQQPKPADALNKQLKKLLGN